MKKIILIFLFTCSFLLTNQNKAFASDPSPNIRSVEAYQARNNKNCNFFAGCVLAGQDVVVNLSGLSYANGATFPDGAKVKVRLVDTLGCTGWPDGIELDGSTSDFKYLEFDYKDGKTNFTIPGREIENGCAYGLEVQLSNDYTDNPNGGWLAETKNDTIIVATSIEAQAECSASQCNTKLNESSTYSLCSQIKTGTDQEKACSSCFSSKGIWTAIGCIPSNPQKIIQTIITIGLSLGGGIVLIMILAGSFMLSVSQGDPNKTKEAKEMITSAIIGLLFVIFSVTILQFIGVSILHIPGFGE